MFARLSSVFSNELVFISLAPCHSLNQGCKRFLKRFHASCKQNKTLFDTISTFLYMLIIHQKVAHEFRVLTASKPMKLNLMLQTWKLLVYVARFRKKNIIVWRTLAKIVEKIKVTKLTYFITPSLHSSNPLYSTSNSFH